MFGVQLEQPEAVIRFWVDQHPFSNMAKDVS